MTTARQTMRREIIGPLKAIATTQRRNLFNHLHIPLFRDGYALLLGSLLTSGLGAVYWIVAARLYPDEIVGMNATAISSMMFLSVVALLNLPNALARLIPSAGRHVYRLIAYSYLIAIIFSAIAGVVFVLGTNIWAPSLTLFESERFTWWFILAVITWSVFSLQDTVFLGLRRAVYLPVLNGIFAVTKIALLVVMLGLLPGTGVFASWTIPTVISLLPIGYLIFRRILPRYASEARRDSTLTLSQVKRYIAADYIGNTFWWAAVSLMPLIITHQLGPAATAYFYLSWSITVTLYLIAINLGAAMLVEGSGDPSRLPVIQSHVLLQMFRLVLPGVAILFLFAPNILAIFGPDYATEATTTLRLMAISAIPNAINWYYINIARVQQRTIFIVLPLIILSIFVIGFSLLLLPDYGISAAGFAWLAGQSILAAIMILSNSPGRTYREFVVPLIGAASPWFMYKPHRQDLASDDAHETRGHFTETADEARAHELLHAGQVAFAEGNLERAHDLWREAAYLKPRDERIWLGLFKVVRDDADRRVCLENILVINPKNVEARERLRLNSPQPSTERGITLSPLSWPDWLDRVTAGVLKGASLWLPILVIVAAIALWLSSLGQIDPRQMGDLGLVSILPMAYYVSVSIILVNYCALIQFKPAFTFALILSLLALIVIIHGTPYFIYGTLRYPWAWKHIAMVDYIQRTGSVDLMTDFWSAYHNWPAFFALNALITEIGGFKSSLNYAGYFQVIFNVLNIGPLVVIFRSLTADRRRIWLAVGFFYWTNWISQDYFSPQAFAYFLHLSILAIVMYGLRSQGVTWAGLLAGLSRYGVVRRIQRILETREIDNYQFASPSPAKQIGLLIILLFCMVALVASHQLTPIMTAVALGMLVLFQITKSRGLPLILALLTVIWMFFVARPFLNVYLPEIIHSIGTLTDNVGGNLINLDYASEGLIFVSKVGRIFTVSIIFMAMLGFLQRWRKGYLDLTVVLMVSSAFLMLGLNSYGGEMLFRSLYFALPFLVFLIAGLFYSVRTDADQWWRSFVTICLVSIACVVTFFYPYYGKENQYYVSPYEVESIRYLQENAPQGSMISSIGPDWPITDVNYDNFYYFSFTERFERVDREAMVEEPVERIYDILTRHDYSAAYVLITNSQRAFIESTGHYRPNSLDIILTALHEASEFEVVFENRDAIIFQAITDE